MSSLRKYNNSNLASSNMVSARRDELEKLEKQRLEVNRKLEVLMKRYAKLTGDRKPAFRKFRVGYAPNDWRPTINASGIKRPMKTWVKIAIISCIAVIVAFMIHSTLVLAGIDLVQIIVDICSKIFQPA